jgi:hypothetical protein
MLSGSSQQIIISTSFTSLISTSIIDNQVSFRFAIVEKVVNGSLVGSDADINYRNVVRKMLPSSGGLTYVGALTNGQSTFGDLNFELQWNIKNVYDANNLAVIVFVQLDTDVNPDAGLARGAILQAKQIDVGSGKIIPDASNITSTIPVGKEFSIYPNPSNRMFDIELAQAASQDLNWILYDQAGRQMATGVIEKGMNQTQVSSEDLPSGLYMLHVYNEQINWIPKRVIVVH